MSDVAVKHKTKQAEQTFLQNQTTRASPEKRQATPEQSQKAEDVEILATKHDINVTPRRSMRLALKQGELFKNLIF
jgi:hypothetical protein